MTSREEWRAFVTDSSRAGRYLTSIGTSVDVAEATPIDQQLLVSFLSKLSQSTDDVRLLASVVDLIAGEYRDFCARQLPLLLDSLANERVGEYATVGPALRGNTRWDLTLVGRQAGRLLPTQYVTRLPTRSFALAENALVRWLVENLLNTVDWVERRVGSKALMPQLLGLRSGCEEALRHEWFRQVPPPRAVDHQMRLSAERQRLPQYRSAAKLAARRTKYETRDRVSRWHHIAELLSVNWLQPISDDDLFELYALVLVLDVIENELGQGSPAQYGLVLPDRDHMARFAGSGGQIMVFFDQSPATALKSASYQLDLLNAHDGVSLAPRRPDLLVVRTTPDGRRVMLVEAKKSSDQSYISDSIYKALGYISDFRTLWVASQASPKVVVLVPEKIAPASGVDISKLEVVLCAGDRRDVLASALREGLGL